VAGALDRVHEAFGVVDVVLWVGAGVPGHDLMMVALAAGLKPERVGRVLTRLATRRRIERTKWRV